MKKYLLPLLLLAANANAQTITFQKEIGGADYIQLYRVQQTNEGGYIGAGYAQKFTTNITYSNYVVKTNANGDIQWTNSFTDSTHQNLESIRQTASGNYILTGNQDASSNSSATITKISATGSILWNKIVGVGFNERGTEALEHNGGYVFTGDAFGNNNYAGYILKTDTNGILSWSHFYEMTGSPTHFYSTTPTSDGGLFLTGAVGVTNTSDAYVMKTNSSGAITWVKRYAAVQNDYDAAVDGVQAADGGYVITGTTIVNTFGNYDAFLMKIDNTGAVLWSRKYHIGENNFARAVIRCTDGGYLITGNASTTGAYAIGFAIKTNDTGGVQWTRKMGRNIQDNFESVVQTTDGGYFFAGSTKGPASGSPVGAYLVKTDADGRSGCNQRDTTIVAGALDMQSQFITTPSDVTNCMLTNKSVSSASLGTASTLCTTVGVSPVVGKQTSVTIAPNPAGTQVTISASGSDILELSLTGISGAVVYYKNGVNSTRTTVDVSYLPSGIYFYSVKTTNDILLRGKLVVGH